MAPNVGAVACDFVRGEFKQLETNYSVYRRAGFAGLGVQDLGLNISSFNFNVKKFDTKAGIETFITSIQGVRETIISIEDDFAKIYANLLIQTLSLPTRRAALQPGTANTHAVTMNMSGVQILKP